MRYDRISERFREITVDRDRDRDCESRRVITRVQYDDWVITFRLTENDLPVDIAGWVFKWALYQQQTKLIEVDTVGSSDGAIVLGDSTVVVNVDRSITTVPPGTYTCYLQSIGGGIQKTWTPSGIPVLVLAGVQL